MPRKAPNGDGYVYKRGNTYTARVRSYKKRLPDGTYEDAQEFTKGGFATKKEAHLWCLEHSGCRKLKKSSSLADYYKIIHRDQLQQLSHSKYVNYLTAWKRLEPLHNRKIESISATELCDIVAESCPTHWPANDMKSLLTRIYRLAAADGLVNKDLPSFIQLPPAEEKGQSSFTMNEIASVLKLWKTDHDRIAASILLMCYSSMMPGELFKVKADMVDIENHRIVGAGIKTKMRKEAEIVYSECITHIVQWMMDTADHGYLLSENAYHEKFYPLYYAVLEKCGCRRLTPYACRHTTNTLLAADSRNSNATTAEVMRHSERMNARYTHISSEQAHEAINRLSLPSID